LLQSIEGTFEKASKVIKQLESLLQEAENFKKERELRKEVVSEI
jgi:hypothetical protein